MRRFLNTLIRPLVGPFVRRLDRRVDLLVTRNQDVVAWRRYLPVILDTISSQNAAAREMRRTQDAQGHRIEFVRREVMLESRYPRNGAGTTFAREPRVADATKLVQSGGDVRLNLGAGHIPVDGYLNVDARDLPGIDVVADIRTLPFGAGDVSEIYSAHLLEHFPLEELSRTLLPYWYSLLKPGGRFRAVVPDAETMLTEHAAGRMSFEDLREVTFGGQEYEGDFHFNMFSHVSICELLEKSGFIDAQVEEAARRNGLCYEMQVSAVKPDQRRRDLGD